METKQVEIWFPWTKLLIWGFKACTVKQSSNQEFRILAFLMRLKDQGSS